MIDQFRRDYIQACRENEDRKKAEEKRARQEMAKIAAEKARKVCLFRNICKIEKIRRLNLYRQNYHRKNQNYRFIRNQ